MTASVIYLVGKDDIFREGLKSLLSRNDFVIAGEYDSIEEMPTDPEDSDVLHVIINIDSEGGASPEKISKLKHIYNNSRLVVVSARTEIPAAMPAFSAGIDGYILKDISCPALLGSLRLIIAGEKVYPTFMLAAIATSQPGKLIANDTSRNGLQNGHHLSKQEMKIISCLAKGDPNKIIAHNLNISETTVKVHVKTILRKLGAKNRTQAALWATAQGLVEQPLPVPDLQSNAQVTV